MAAATASTRRRARGPNSATDRSRSMAATVAATASCLSLPISAALSIGRLPMSKAGWAFACASIPAPTAGSRRACAAFRTGATAAPISRPARSTVSMPACGICTNPRTGCNGSRSAMSRSAISTPVLPALLRTATAWRRRFFSRCRRPGSARASNCGPRSARPTRCVSAPTGAAPSGGPRRIISSPDLTPAVTAARGQQRHPRRLRRMDVG